MRVWFLVLLFPALVLLHGPSAGAEEGNSLVPVQIKRILLVNESPAVLLVDKPEDKFLLVFIDFFMANAIRMGMEQPVIERPLTHDLIGIFLHHLGAKVTKIVITELKNNTYYALITLDVNGRAQEIDARPSDALAIAVRHKTPIFASSELLRLVSDSAGGKEEGKRSEAPHAKRKPKAST
jgi:bifunctional DNase/RNase